MINPVTNGYSALWGCEFGTPRIDNDGNVYGHTGWDQGTVDNTGLQAPCDAVVFDVALMKLAGII